MSSFKTFKEEILKEYPRLGPDDTYEFKCHPGVPCFNKCCSDINIFLTPYDVIRLKKGLGITSDEFLSKYTQMVADETQQYPVLQLKMNDTKDKECPFVTDNGCGVYEDRPWPCRMYPLGSASPKDEEEEKLFYFLMKEEICKGFEEKQEWKISDWLKDQDIAKFDEIGEYFKEITLHDFFYKGKTLEPKKMQMFFMVCYNIDSFRKFVFESTFLDRFDVDDKTVNAIKEDDVELFKFGVSWLKFSLFGENTLTLKKTH
ncbi:YkgJ family cysteine cluster protein [candidate division KSB1 bacterium]